MVEIVFIWMNLYFSTKVLSSLKLPFPSPCLKKGPPILASTEWETIAEMAVVLQKSAGAVWLDPQKGQAGSPYFSTCGYYVTPIRGTDSPSLSIQKGWSWEGSCLEIMVVSDHQTMKMAILNLLCKLWGRGY